MLFVYVVMMYDVYGVKTNAITASSLCQEVVESGEGVFVGPVEDEVVGNQLQAVYLGLKYLFALCSLLSRSHQSSLLSHGVHGSRHLLPLLVHGLHALLVPLVVKEERLELVESEHDQEVEGDRGDVADVESGHVDARLREGPELLGHREGHLGQDEPCEEGVYPGHGRNCGSHHHQHPLHVVHHPRLGSLHVVERVDRRPVPVDHQVALLGPTEEASAGVEGLASEEVVFFGEVLALLHEVFVLGVGVVGLFDFLLGFGVGRVEVVVESEELNDAGHVDDRDEDPGEHPFVQKQPHQLSITTPNNHLKTSIKSMSAEQHPWKQFFTFFAMRKQEPIRIPKEDLQTVSQC